MPIVVQNVCHWLVFTVSEIIEPSYYIDFHYPKGLVQNKTLLAFTKLRMQKIQEKYAITKPFIINHTVIFGI